MNDKTPQPPVAATPTPLSDDERSALAELEATIKEHLHGFQQVGFALIDIQVRKLYRETHATFEDYVRDRFGMSKQHAYRFIDGAKTADLFAPDEQPANEAQARALTAVRKKHSEKVMKDAYAEARKATGGKVTAEAILEAAGALTMIDMTSDEDTTPRALSAHDALSVVPLMGGADYERLRESIAANGLREPITLWNDQIIDGRARYEACVELGIEPKTRTIKARDFDPFEYVEDANLRRRHLTPDEVRDAVIESYEIEVEPSPTGDNAPADDSFLDLLD